MRKKDLWFYKNRDPDGLIHLRSNTSIEAIPDHPGAYVFGTSDGTRLIYPNGKTPIFYIGRSSNLYRRILRHFHRIQRVEGDDTWWVKKYEYAAAFGATIAWYSIRCNQSTESLEADLVDEFYRCYYSIPIANGAWPSGDKVVFDDDLL